MWNYLAPIGREGTFLFCTCLGLFNKMGGGGDLNWSWSREDFVRSFLYKIGSKSALIYEYLMELRFLTDDEVVEISKQGDRKWTGVTISREYKNSDLRFWEGKDKWIQEW